MIWPDYAILASILISILVGLLRGFIKEVLSLLVWAVAFFVAFRYGGNLAQLMENQVTLPSARAIMGFTGLFIGVLLIGGLVTYLVGRLVVSTGLDSTDRLLGAAFGAARGLAIVTIFLLAMGFTPIPADPWWKESALIQRMLPVLQWSAAFLPQEIRQHIDFSPKSVDTAKPQRGRQEQRGKSDGDHPAEKERTPA